MAKTATFKVWRTHPEGDGTFQTFHTEVTDGMVVLDVVHKIQAEQAPDLAVRWELQGRQMRIVLGEINGKPRTDVYDASEPGEPAGARSPWSRCARFRRSRIWSPDVSWNFGSRKASRKFKPRPGRCVRRHVAHAAARHRSRAGIPQVHRVLLCARTCATSCAITTSTTSSSARGSSSYAANLEMNPLDTDDRVPDLKEAHGIGYCNITKCCTKVCPEHIHITDKRHHPAQGESRRPILRPAHEAAAGFQIVGASPLTQVGASSLTLGVRAV
jgi:succinate dehydrogenase / fumarate reductase iron-sulfur subunit